MSRSARHVAAVSSFVLSVGVALFPGGARAQDRSADAERLFREAQQLLEAKDYANACPKLERAYALDRKLGTLINLAFCHKSQDAWWLAWIEFRQAELMAMAQGRTDRRDFVRQQLTEIEKKGKLAVVMIDNPRHEPLTEVLVEDRKMPDAENGAIFMVEPTGAVDRKFTFRAKGKKSVERLVKIVRSDKSIQHVVVPTLEDQEPEPEAAPPPAPPPPDHAAVPPAPANDGRSQRLVGWIVTGTGAAALGVGGYFGIEALGSPCAGSSKNPPCTSEAKSTADKEALASTILVAGGAVAVAGGLWLVLTAQRDAPKAGARIAPTVGLGYAGVQGRF